MKTLATRITITCALLLALGAFLVGLVLQQHMLQLAQLLQPHHRISPL